MAAKVSDPNDPELDELEPVSSKEPVGRSQMAYQGPVEGEPRQQEQEAKPVKVTGPINIKGTAYNAGDTVMLTDEERESVTASGAPIEGVDALDEDEIQSKHEEGVEAQKQRIEEDQKAVDEQDEKNKAEAKGRETRKSAEENEKPRHESHPRSTHEQKARIT